MRLSKRAKTPSRVEVTHFISLSRQLHMSSSSLVVSSTCTMVLLVLELVLILILVLQNAPN